ncbi:hypothetical protein PIB30_020733 [Stylosanthes scabra]|uniref:Uncharacterized protein n=1 Tax=Stylosanthes scabra TaxID=79078 RepID=A0ABU6Y701_9FABA|nr:hypothetical protein [Stylosanthes scabra]
MSDDHAQLDSTLMSMVILPMVKTSPSVFVPVLQSLLTGPFVLNENDLDCSESTRTSCESIHKLIEGSRVNLFMDRDEIDLKTLQGVDSVVFESTQPLKMSLNESCESTRGESKSIHTNDERYVSQEVKEGIFGINFLASGNSGLSVVKGAEGMPLS